MLWSSIANCYPLTCSIKNCQTLHAALAYIDVCDADSMTTTIDGAYQQCAWGLSSWSLEVKSDSCIDVRLGVFIPQFYAVK